MVFRTLVVALIFVGCTQNSRTAWPEISRETKPWTRWWWHGSSLTKEGITAELEAYAKAGLGGVEITPIYGVRGNEANFVPYLSKEWVDLLIYTLSEADRLDMGVDMATGTGWPFGGPWVSDQYASRNIFHKEYELKTGQSLKEKIEFIQPPYLRTVNPIDIDIKQISQPVESNKNLQQLAIDQIQFERPLPLRLLMAYSDKGESLNITDKVNSEGKLEWTPDAGTWKLYALFEGWHGKMVERAGPGGEGNVIDHFSSDALHHYLNRFDSALSGRDISKLRAFFNDSYEVDDARGAADWTSDLLGQFKKNRGYNLEDHLPKLFGPADDKIGKRILYDYRLTISEMLLENFTRPWTAWASKNGAVTRNQAHGSPANILDLYAAVDIPEIEGTEPLRIKMASSAANVMGKRLVSSESATWLDEHFESSLGDIKGAVDLFLMNGVNHIFYHGTTYSPPGEEWPGWLFYAAVHLNPRNPEWTNFDVLNNYVARCQSFLQNTKPFNDVLLYYPVADPMSTFGPEMIEHFDGIGKQFEGSAFEDAAKRMMTSGYTFDYISDRQIRNVKFENNNLVTEGKSEYKTIVVPYCEYIPLETLEHLMSLVEAGANVIMYRGVPYSFAGFGDLEKKEESFGKVMDKFRERIVDANGVASREIGKGRLIIGDTIEIALMYASVMPNTMARLGVEFTRRKFEDGRIMYLIHNSTGEFLRLGPDDSEAIYDPMTGTVVDNYIMPNQTVIIASTKTELKQVETFDPPFSSDDVNGPWNLTFISGGAVLPQPLDIDTLGSWTNYAGDEYKEFSGTAIYRTKLKFPESDNGWTLDLGDVKESAVVRLNGREIASLISPPFLVKIEPSMAQSENVLEVEVTNLMANRIISLEKKGVQWKKFYNINFPARKPENRKDGLFNASEWVPRPSGLLGPVQLLSSVTEARE